MCSSKTFLVEMRLEGIQLFCLCLQCNSHERPPYSTCHDVVSHNLFGCPFRTNDLTNALIGHQFPRQSLHEIKSHVSHLVMNSAHQNIHIHMYKLGQSIVPLNHRSTFDSHDSNRLSNILWTQQSPCIIHALPGK